MSAPSDRFATDSRSRRIEPQRGIRRTGSGQCAQDGARLHSPSSLEWRESEGSPKALERQRQLGAPGLAALRAAVLGLRGRTRGRRRRSRHGLRPARQHAYPTSLDLDARVGKAGDQFRTKKPNTVNPDRGINTQRQFARQQRGLMAVLCDVCGQVGANLAQQLFAPLDLIE